MRSRTLAVAVVLLLELGTAGAADAWTRRVPGVASLDDQLRGVARDPAGDLIVADDGGVAKHAHAGGAPLWRTSLIDVVNTVNHVTGVTTDVAGDVVVIGAVADLGVPTDAMVWKLSGADGHLLWSLRFDGPGRSSDYAIDVAVDASGDVIVGGVSYLIVEDMLALKIDGQTGAEKWHAVVPGPSVGSDQGLAVAIDANGDVAVAGDSTTAGFNDRFAAIKLRGTDGKLLWRAFAGGSNDGGQATDAAFDAAGDLVVIGSIAVPMTDSDVAVVKFDGATGAERWHHYVSGSARESEFGARLAIDASGNIVAVGGVVNADTGDDVLVLLLSPDGSQVWRREIDGGTAGYDDAFDVALVGDRVVVAAAVDGRTYDDTHFASFGLDAATGADVWRLDRDGEADGRDRAIVALPGIGGEVVVAGPIVNRSSKTDPLVLEIDATSGEVRRERNLNRAVHADGEATGVAIDGSGDAVVAGVTFDPSTGTDATVVKLGGSTGAELWRARIDGALHGDDSGGPVVVGALGEVFVGAATIDGPGGPPPAPRLPPTAPLVNVSVVKLDGSTGAEAWRSEAPGRGFPRADDLVLAAGDPVVAGWFGGAQYESIPAVARVDAASGTTRWVTAFGPIEYGPRQGAPVRLDVDPTGDLIAAVHQRAVRLDGDGGAVLWRAELTVETADLAVDAHGDVFVVGASPFGFAIEKRRGTDGASLWAVTAGIGRALAVRLDDSGDVFVAGAMDRRGQELLAVVRVDGATGDVQWSRIVPAHAPARGLALTLDAAGSLLVGGASTLPGRAENFALRKLRATDGGLRWRRDIDGGGRSDDRAQALAVDAAGNVIAAGVLRGADDVADFAVVRFDGRTGRWR